MIDSVSIRLHDSKDEGSGFHHHQIFELLVFASTANADTVGVEQDFISYRNFIKAGGLNVKTYDIINEELFYCDTQKTTKIVKGHLPSSNHYGVGYRVNFDRDFVDISLSIPKYIYGNNVPQLVCNPHALNKNFKGLRSTFEENSKDAYDNLIKFVKLFFTELFATMLVDYRKVEIVRIDFCFNQYFRNKGEALRNLQFTYDQVHQHGFKMAESELRVTPEGNHGLISVGKHHYYKIYHKGNEFETVGDKKTLIKQNEQFARELRRQKELKKTFEDLPDYNPKLKTWDIERLQQEADKILRHEARLVPSSMSYYFKRHVYKSNCPIWKREFVLYNEIKAKQMRYRRSNMQSIEDKLTPDEKLTLDSFEEKINLRHRFYLEPTAEQKKDQSSSSSEQLHLKEQYLSRKLFNYLLNNVFYRYVTSSQVTEVTEQRKIEELIHAHNKKIDDKIREILVRYPIKSDQDKIKKSFGLKKITVSLALKILDNLNEFGSLAKMQGKSRMSRATRYRHSKILKIIQMSTSIQTGSPIRIDTTYGSYFESIMIDHRTERALFGNMKKKYKQDF